MKILMRDGITAKERLQNLGLHTELKLTGYFEKSKRAEKLKRLVKLNIINTQKKGWN